MERPLTTSVLALVLVLPGCADRAQPGPAYGPAPAPETDRALESVEVLLLTPLAPRTEFELAAPPPNPKDSHPLTLEVLAIELPTGGSFELRVLALWRDGLGPHQLELGRVTPYPADQPGRFTLRGAENADELFAFEPPDLRGVVELVPLGDSPLPESLRVELLPPTWRAGE